MNHSMPRLSGELCSTFLRAENLGKLFGILSRFVSPIFFKHYQCGLMDISLIAWEFLKLIKFFQLWPLRALPVNFCVPVTYSQYCGLKKTKTTKTFSLFGTAKCSKLPGLFLALQGVLVPFIGRMLLETKSGLELCSLLLRYPCL